MAKKAAKKKAAKKAAKPYAVSPLRGMPVDEWTKKHTKAPWQTEAVAKLVRLVKRTVPDATVSIKWAQPVFELNGPIAFIKPAKAHLSFGFWRGAELADPKGILEPGDRMGHVKYRALADIDEAALAPMIAQAAQLNRDKGSPTKRS